MKDEFVEDQKALEEGDLMHEMFSSPNDKHAVIFGMQSTIKTILMCNIMVSCLFMLQGLRMIQVAAQTLLVCLTLKKGDIQEGP